MLVDEGWRSCPHTGSGLFSILRNVTHDFAHAALSEPFRSPYPDCCDQEIAKFADAAMSGQGGWFPSFRECLGWGGQRNLLSNKLHPAHPHTRSLAVRAGCLGYGNRMITREKRNCFMLLRESARSEVRKSFTQPAVLVAPRQRD